MPRKWILLVCSLALASPALAQHAGHAQPTLSSKPASSPEAQASQPKTDHAQMDHAQMSQASIPTLPHEPIPPPTDADRAAAFPTVHAHHQHGTAIQQYWLLDRFEIADGDHGSAIGWEANAWIGGDVRKLWLRSEGHAEGGHVQAGDIEVLYGQGVRAWWDVVAGIRHDLGEGPSRTWAAFGVQGLAPYKYELSATAYLGQGGRTAARVEAEYQSLLSNRLILQWRAEASLHGKDDPALAIGAGLSTLEAGLRLRYEIRRQFAPYVGIEREWVFGNTARFRRADGEAVHDTRVVAGLRVWL